MRARICSVLLLSALAASSLAAGPGPATGESGASGSVRLAIEDGEVSLTGLGFDHRRAFDLIADQPGLPGIRAAMRAHATETLGLDLPLLAERGADAEPGATEGTRSREAYAWPVGDIDGDGLGDIYSFEYDADDGGLTVVARRGVDGTALWSRTDESAADLIPMPIGDVDGDDVVDLLVWGLEYDGAGFVTSCAEEGCEGSEEAALTWTIGIASGADGADVWTERVEGEIAIRYRYAYGGVDPLVSDSAEEVEVVGRNSFVLPQLSGDHDGDGVADLLFDVVRSVDYRVERSHRSVSDVLSEREESFELDLDNDLEIRTLGGNVIAELPFGPTELAIVTPLPSATADLLLVRDEAVTGSWGCREVIAVGEVGPCTAPERLPTTVSVLDGRSLEPRWTRELSSLQYAIVEPFDDLDGDGHVELLVLDLFDVHAEMLDGATGNVVWSDHTQEEPAYAFSFPTGDLTGDGIRDLFSYVERFEEDERETITLQRRDGRTGAPVATTEHVVPRVDAEEYRFTSISLLVGPELDGGPGQDVALEVDVASEKGAEGYIVGESGRGGAPLVELDGVAWDLWDVAPLTGGVVDDLILRTPLPRFIICEDEECTYPPREVTFQAVALTGAPLWSRDVDLDRGYLYAIGDRDGQGGTELLVEGYTEDADGRSTAGYLVVNGSDLRTLWGRGTRPPGI